MENKSEDQIRIEILVDATVQKVWNAWTEPALIRQWIGSDPEGRGLDAELNVFPGGGYEIHFMNADGTEHTCYGIYREVVEFRKLSFSWRWKSEPEVESMVTISLISLGNQTIMHFKHEGFGYESAHGYEKGWTDTFSKLKRVLIKAEDL